MLMPPGAMQHLGPPGAPPQGAVWAPGPHQGMEPMPPPPGGFGEFPGGPMDGAQMVQGHGEQMRVPLQFLVRRRRRH